jgi:hypothetical protein
LLVRAELRYATAVEIGRFLAGRWPSAVLVAASIALYASAPAVADAAHGPSLPCSTYDGHGVVINACSYSLEPSPAGNANYFVNIVINYTAPPNTSAVRFRCMLGNGSSTIPQYGVLRASPGTMRFVSPFVSDSSVLKSVGCYVDAT